jgi:hypothetical protein
VVPLTIVFARVFASLFEIPFRARSHPAHSVTSSVCAPRRAFVTR